MSDAIDIEVQECRGDFWCRLEKAMQQAGGGYPIDRITDMKLKDIVDVLAQNGIRMTYDKCWHIDAIAEYGLPKNVPTKGERLEEEGSV